MPMLKNGNGGGLPNEQKDSLHNNGFAYSQPMPQRVKPLWTNPAPTSNFAEQDVIIEEYDKYNMFLLVFALHTSNVPNEPLSYYFYKGTGGIIASHMVGETSVCGRLFIPIENGVHFQGGFIRGNADNSRIIPIKILGIKL